MKTCPKCNQQTMPSIAPGSEATARRCQNTKCGHVEELRTQDASHAAVKPSPEAKHGA